MVSKATAPTIFMWRLLRLIPHEVVANKVLTKLEVTDLTRLEAAFATHGSNVEALHEMLRLTKTVGLKDIEAQGNERNWNWLFKWGICIDCVYISGHRKIKDPAELLQRMRQVNSVTLNICPGRNTDVVRTLLKNTDFIFKVHNLNIEDPSPWVDDLLPMRNIKSLVVLFTPITKLVQLILSNHQLRHLHLYRSNLEAISTDIFAAVAVRGATLTSLSLVLAQPSAAGKGVLASLAEYCTALQHVLINHQNWNNMIVESGTLAFAKANPRLLSLTLSGIKPISVDVLLSMAMHCPLLERFDVLIAEIDTQCLHEEVAILCQRCPHLESLQQLTGRHTTDVYVLALADHCPQLTFLYLMDSLLVSEAAVTVLLQRCAKLACVYVPRYWYGAVLKRMQVVCAALRGPRSNILC